MNATSRSALAVPSRPLTPAERTADAQANYLAACEAMRQRRDQPAWRASQGKPTARVHSVPLTVTVESERHGVGRLWFDGASWHPLLVLGRRSPRLGPWPATAGLSDCVVRATEALDLGH